MIQEVNYALCGQYAYIDYETAGDGSMYILITAGFETGRSHRVNQGFHQNGQVAQTHVKSQRM